MFVIGFLASFVIGIGVVMVQNAIKVGPAGPVMGLCAMASPILVIILALFE